MGGFVKEIQLWMSNPIAKANSPAVEIDVPSRHEPDHLEYQQQINQVQRQGLFRDVALRILRHSLPNA